MIVSDIRMPKGQSWARLPSLVAIAVLNDIKTEPPDDPDVLFVAPKGCKNAAGREADDRGRSKFQPVKRFDHSLLAGPVCPAALPWPQSGWSPSLTQRSPSK